MKEKIKKRYPDLFGWLHCQREKYYTYLGRIYPKYLLKTWYRELYGKRPNLKDPKDIDEKICWMKLHGDMSLWTRCADKFAVRQYVEECGLGFTLNEIYGCYDDASEIDFDALPTSFVIKSTNGGGGNNVLIVTDKSTLDISSVRQKLNNWLKLKVGYRYYEPHYIKIKPRLLVEKYLKPVEGETSLIDYKFNCFDGRAYSIFMCSERKFHDSVYYSCYDLNWHFYPENMKAKYRTEKKYPSPHSLKKMIEYSEKLSHGIPYVRVDWYEIDGEPVFSEMTFTPGGGFQNYYTEAYRIELGQQMNIPIKKEL